ncbi:MAG: histidine kinase [Acidobacteriota bacterium]|nr:histidine kinase [Acidobacteriota bacterium]
MSNRGDGPPGTPKVSWILAGWTLSGLFFAFQEYFQRISLGRPVSLWAALAAWLSDFYIWAAFTPLILLLSRRYPLDRGRWQRHLPVHFIICIVISVAQSGLFLLARQLLLRDWYVSRPRIEQFKLMLVAEFNINVILYIAILSISHALYFYRSRQESELTASQLETKLARAQLDALRMQLHPHFLFNTLNSISVLMLKDVRQARRMLGRLSDLLRATLKESNSHEVPLREELRFLRSYLEIEQTRYSDRLQVSMLIDPAALEALVPTLILQPIVENAIRHGIARRAEPGLVEIYAERSGATLCLRVRDNGAGLGSDFLVEDQHRVGLSNTRARLVRLYGDLHSFELAEAPGGGVVVTISLPFKEGAGAPGDPAEDVESYEKDTSADHRRRTTGA